MGNISKNKDIKNTELEIWEFLYREWAKLNDIARIYDKIAINININDDRYNQFLGLLLDMFTRQMVVSLDLFFQTRSNVWSLYKIDGIPESRIGKIKKQAEEFIDMRNNKVAHLSEYFKHNKNFEYFTKKGIESFSNILNEIDVLLQEVKNGRSYSDDWIGIETSLDLLFEDLNKIKK